MSLKNFLLNLLFPKKCLGCKKNDTWLCSNCLSSLELYQGEKPRALKDSRNLIIAGEYHDKLLGKLITDFKFDLNKELIIPLFIFLKKAIDKKIMIDNLSGRQWKDVLVIPIPLHKKRLRWRGFNQSELLAREVSNYYEFSLNLNLIRIKKNKNQVELSEEERLKNVSGIFKWQGEDLTGKTILLIDDVITSGATMNEAEKILLTAGACRVIKVAAAKG